MRAVLAVYENGEYRYVNVDNIIASLRRDGEAILVDYEDVFTTNVVYVYPGLVDFDLKGGHFVNTFKKYMGTQLPKLTSKCSLVERGLNYIVVQRYDRALFKLVHPYIAEILLNVLNNPGIALWDLISAELAINAKEIPDLTEEEAQQVIETVVDAIGYYVYILDLVQMELGQP